MSKCRVCRRVVPTWRLIKTYCSEACALTAFDHQRDEEKHEDRDQQCTRLEKKEDQP